MLNCKRVYELWRIQSYLFFCRSFVKHQENITGLQVSFSFIFLGSKMFAFGFCPLDYVKGGHLKRRR